MENTRIYLETGSKKTFAGAIDWPGWCRSGRDEALALHALLESGPRYARVMRYEKIDFQPPKDASSFQIIDRLEGSATTDFGAPDMAPLQDDEPLDDETLYRYQAILRACWQAFDTAVRAAVGKELRKGPRGGGRELEPMIRHVLGADWGYLSRIGWKAPKNEELDLQGEVERIRQNTLEALNEVARNGVPESPRGGARWTPRYYVRRVAWHVLDHAWELEDRILEPA